MGQETIDIVVKETGADKAARDILNIGTSADTSDDKLTKLNATISGLAASVDKNTTAVEATTAAAQSHAGAEDRASAAVKGHAASMESGAAAAEQLRGVLVSLGLALGASEWLKLTDAYQSNVNQLRQVATSAENFAALQERLHTISGETFSDLSTNTRLFVSLTKASRDLQLSQGDVLNVVHVLNDALRLGGATSEEAGNALGALSVALQRGSISARQILPLLHQMPDLMAALADKFGYTGNRTAEFVAALTSGQVPVRALLQGIIGLDDTLTAGARATDAHSAALNKNLQSIQILRAGTDSFSASSASARAHVLTLSQSVLNMDNDVTKAGHSMQQAGLAGNALAQKFQQVTPTLKDAWKNVQTALEGYVGAQDRMTAGSSRVAQALQFIAENSHTVFGALQIMAAALGTYTLAVNASRIATLLFASTFSPLALIVTIIATAAAAMVAFGNDIKVTADGSVTALTLLYGIFNLVRDVISKVWEAIGQTYGAWGQYAEAVLLAGTALKLFLGIDLLSWLTAAVAGLGRLALATYAAIGPWGLLATAVITAGLALAYYSGSLDSAIASIKEKFAPAIDYVLGKLDSSVTKIDATSIAIKDFGKSSEDAAAQVMQSFDNMGNAVGSATSQIQGALKGSETGFQDWAGEVTSDMSKVLSSAQSTASALKSLGSSSGHMGSDFISNFTGDFFADNAGGNHKGGVVFNNSGVLSSSDLTHAHFASGGSFLVGGQGGTDSQLVKFMASPDERVTVETPAQQRQRNSGSAPIAVHVAMTVVAKDANSFDQSRQQTVMSLQSELTRALSRLGQG